VRLLVDILHPAHVHVFGALARELGARGHEVRFTLREKECARELLDQQGLSYQTLSQQHRGLGLASEFVQRSARLWNVVSEFRPHFLAGIMGPSITMVGRLRRALGHDRTRVAVFYDTEIAKLTNTIVYPLADYVCTPDCYWAPVPGNHLTYPGYHELAYLHPNRFTPDPEVVHAMGIDPTSPYYLLRFVSYQASHDLGTVGLTIGQKIMLARTLREYGTVYVSSEGPLPDELEAYRLHIPASDIHHVVAFARLLVGESATMASEAAVLGVPAVYISPHGRGYTDDQERRYDLVKNFTGDKFLGDWLSEVRRLAADPELREKARAARTRMLSEKTDVAAWMADFFQSEFDRHFADRAA
jgi:predicted glycosyltransferase